MSEYSELVKNYSKIREYLRDFYIYGFRSRDNYTEKSGRSYDNERRRIESYLSSVIFSRTENDGKKFFITADASEFFENPLFKTFKSKSFTKNDVTLHFAILYVLEKCGPLSLAEIDIAISKHITSYFDEDSTLDIATVRNKLKEYIKDGIVTSEKVKGKMIFALKKREDIAPLYDALYFYTSTFPLGVIGSFILDKTEQKNTVFTNKHTYFSSALDSEMIYTLLCAIHQKKAVMISSPKREKSKNSQEHFLPFKVAITVQSGRNYVMGYSLSRNLCVSFRLDNTTKITVLDDTYADYDDIKAFFEQKLNNVWGVSIDSNNPSEHLLVDIRVDKGEEYIVDRIRREKRIGTFSKLSDNLYRMEFDLIDLSEIIPWVRTFIGRIENMECSNKKVLKRFLNDVEEMKKLYGEDE